MSSPEPDRANEHAPILLDVARRSIDHGVRAGAPLPVDPAEFPPALRAARATFITLHRIGQLRGCVGGLEPRLPLVADVAQSAFAAAFRDTRFAPVGAAELDDLHIHISILSPLEPVVVRSEEELLEKLRPGVDGLVLREGSVRGTFLPAVWERLPEPRQFLFELKRKAGFQGDYWSPRIEFQRYTVESISQSPSCEAPRA
jgi:AmmeMemoRadiSam system protein A